MSEFSRHRVVPRRRSLSVIRNGAVLAAVMTFAVMMTAVVFVYGQRVGSPGSSSWTSLPGGSPLPEPGPDTPTADVMPSSTRSPLPPTVAASKRVVTPSAGRPATPTRPPTFAAIAIQAEASGNTRTGGAAVVSCDACAGGARVGYIGGPSQLFIDLSLPAAGRRTVVLTYESDGPRTLEVSANGTPIARQELTGVGWETPMTYEIVTLLPAGPLRLGFFDSDGPAPDIDLVVVR